MVQKDSSTPKVLKLPFVSVKNGSAYISNVEYAMFNIDSEPCLTETKGNFRTFGNIYANLNFIGTHLITKCSGRDISRASHSCGG